MQDAIGWASSAILLATIASQILKQWREGNAQGVSRWLFVGQVAASAGFVVYSWMVRNWVFVFTNSLILLSALVGAALVWKQKSGRRKEGGGATIEHADA